MNSTLLLNQWLLFFFLVYSTYNVYFHGVTRMFLVSFLLPFPLPVFFPFFFFLTFGLFVFFFSFHFSLPFKCLFPFRYPLLFSPSTLLPCPPSLDPRPYPTPMLVVPMPPPLFPVVLMSPPDEDFTLSWDGSDDTPDTLRRLVDRAHESGKRVKLSVGGWTGSK